jgi:hypothetical protein
MNATKLAALKMFENSNSFIRYWATYTLENDDKTSLEEYPTCKIELYKGGNTDTEPIITTVAAYMDQCGYTHDIKIIERTGAFANREETEQEYEHLMNDKMLAISIHLYDVDEISEMELADALYRYHVSQVTTLKLAISGHYAA